MPITTSPNSYLPTMQKFDQHWAQVNAHSSVSYAVEGEGEGSKGAAPPMPFVLPNGYTQAQLGNDRQALTTAIAIATQNATAAGNASQTYQNARTVVRGRLQMLRDAVLYLIPTSSYAKTFPTMPTNSKDDNALFKALNASIYLWNAISDNATLPAPARNLVLRDGTTRAQYAQSIIDLRQLQTASVSATKTANVAIAQRDSLLPAIRANLVSYRQGIPSTLGPTNPLTKSLPALYAKKGATPPPVAVTVSYDAITKATTVTWTASTDPNLARYKVRICTGAKWKEANVRATVSVASSVLTWNTTDLQAGQTYCAKVYVVLQNGQQRGSTAMPITIPTPKGAGAVALSELLSYTNGHSDEHTSELVGVNGSANGNGRKNGRL